MAKRENDVDLHVAVVPQVDAAAVAISPDAAGGGMTTTTIAASTNATANGATTWTSATVAAASAFAASFAFPPSPPAGDSNKSTIPPLPRTYFASKRSIACETSNRLLREGMLDEALSNLENALRTMRGGEGGKGEGKGGSFDELHESLAPLYYLYGTTLLYSVEESDVMMADGGGGGGGVDGGNKEGGEDDDDNDNDEDDGKEEGEGEEGGGEEDEDGVVGTTAVVRNVADPALDLEVAWENLDLARAIVSRLVGHIDVPSDRDDFGEGGDDGNVIVPVKGDREDDRDGDGGRDELLIDLAQIHLRLGDLQRQNDNVRSCIDDYERSLTLRTKVVGRYDRKVANCHFSLAQAYAEAPNKIIEGEGRLDAFVTGLVGPDGVGQGCASSGGGDVGGGGTTSSSSSSSSQLTEEKKAEYRLRSSEHYLACGISLAGMLARMCGIEDVEGFVSVVNETSSSSAFASSASSSTATATDNAAAISRLRQRTSTLVPPPPWNFDVVVMCHRGRNRRRSRDHGRDTGGDGHGRRERGGIEEPRRDEEAGGRGWQCPGLPDGRRRWGRDHDRVRRTFRRRSVRGCRVRGRRWRERERRRHRVGGCGGAADHDDREEEEEEAIVRAAATSSARGGGIDEASQDRLSPGGRRWGVEEGTRVHFRHARYIAYE